MPAYKVALRALDRDRAWAVHGVLAEFVVPAPAALTLFEAPAGWTVDAYFLDPPDVAALGQQMAELLSTPPPDFHAEELADENWVAISQSALPPVAAGRFTVHGSHDRERLIRGPNRLLIDAGEAFGTGHHATTEGCLLALDRLTRRRKFRSVLDLGCGSGVLAIAAARALPFARIAAIDCDPVAVAVASANARINGVARRIRFATGSGLAPTRRYDLVLANILAQPLILLAPAMARAVVPGGAAVLSGILVPEAARVIASYRAAGFTLLGHHRNAGWSTLTLLRRCSTARSRAGRARHAA
jgi:ribosomal protein L11 methyltransferase